MKYCDLRHKKFLKSYIVVFKYKNKIGYFTDFTKQHSGYHAFYLLLTPK